MIFEICAALATIGFIVLIIYLIQTLIVFQKALKQIIRLTANIETTLDPISSETIKILQNSNLSNVVVCNGLNNCKSHF